MKHLLQNINQKVKIYLHNRHTRRAIKRAFAAFSQQYPQWANSLFDIYFLQHQAALMDTGQRQPEPAALADAYLAMVNGPKPVQARQRDAVLPVASAFIRLMAAEL